MEKIPFKITMKKVTQINVEYLIIIIPSQQNASKKHEKVLTKRQAR